MAGPLVDLKQTHAHLLQDCNCVEAAPAAKAADADADNAEAPAAAHLSLPPLNMLARQHLLSEEEIVAGCSPPMQRRVTTQIMRYWEPHLTAQEEPPSSRRKNLCMLRSMLGGSQRHLARAGGRARPLHPAARYARQRA
jgi:hypothetical protein